jgi:hypothetical protein
MISRKLPYLVPPAIVAAIVLLANAKGLNLEIINLLYYKTIELLASGVLSSYIIWHLIMKRRFKKDSLKTDTGNHIISGIYISLYCMFN